MPIGAELLNSIPGPNPSGANLRYDPIYDKIKEARREEDEIPQGEMVYAIKKADWPLVVKLCSEALTNKSKDLQLAAWLTEALVRREAFAGLRQGLDLCRGLLEQFWDTLYPEPEDGDLELRATPLDWIGSRLDATLKKAPLTRSGLDWYKYKESRAVGYETDVGESETKRAAREQATADGKLTAEEFDKAVLASSKDSYKQKIADIDACTETIDALAQACEQRFGDFNPSFSGLRDSLELQRQTIKSLLAKKLEQEPDEEQPAETASDEQPAEEMACETVGGSGAAAAPARAAARKTVTAEPVDRDDAFERVAAVARWLRTQDTYSPVPYVMLRALRWSELRANGADIDANLLVAPPTELRQRIKRLANDGSWEELIGACEDAMSMSCARGWLDLQRYFIAACDGYGGYDYVKNSVLAELKSLLADYPALPQMNLADDTPTANAETQAWLQTVIVTSARTQEQYATAPTDQEPALAPDQPPDAFELAKAAAHSGDTGEAIAILTRKAAQEPSGRARFQRKVQLAQICMASGHEALAFPILEGLAGEIEERRLEDWESPELLAHALTLLFRCMSKLKEDTEQKQRLYARICRLDPLQALELAR
jgi:type VI secretion system protein ImpA